MAVFIAFKYFKGDISEFWDLVRYIIIGSTEYFIIIRFVNLFMNNNVLDAVSTIVLSLSVIAAAVLALIIFNFAIAIVMCCLCSLIGFDSATSLGCFLFVLIIIAVFAVNKLVKTDDGTGIIFYVVDFVITKIASAVC